MKIAALIFAVAGLVSAGGCTNPTSNTAISDTGKNEKPATPATKANPDLAKWQHATFAGGCFWCEEAVFESIKGVKEVVSGYSGGHTENPTYEESGTGSTGHAEAIEIYFDSTVVTYSSLVKVFMASIDPYQVNGQGPDRGSQYRSIIFYRTPAEKAVAEKALADPRLTAQGKVAVELKPFEKFWDGEEYHQNYVPQHPENPYVQHESIPRLKRTQAKVMELVDPSKVAK